jgi:hypothetical protein
VPDDHGPIIEMHEQILGPTPYLPHRPAGQLLGEVPRHREAQVTSANGNMLNALANKMPRKSAADGLDFGQLRHNREAYQKSGDSPPRAQKI